MAYDPNAVNAELQDRLVGLRLILEGHEDDARLNVESTTIDDVQVQIARFSALIAAVEGVYNANLVLLEAGWPELLPLEVEDTVIADLEAQIASLIAARGTYSSNKARSMALKSDAPVPKS